MNTQTEKLLLRRIADAFGTVRAEHESESAAFDSFTVPTYFPRLMGATPTFLIGGRGTGKTTTLRSMSFKGQAAISRHTRPAEWLCIGAYWKLEPSTVAAFQGRGVDDDVWSRAFAHYLNLRLASMVLEYGVWLERHGRKVEIDESALRRFAMSMHLRPMFAVAGLLSEVDDELARLESRLNGSSSRLAEMDSSLAGRPLDYLFDALHGLEVDRAHPFLFCLDEYENLTSVQQRVLNTVIKQAGSGPFSVKIGVRNTLAIDRRTLISGQPIQDPADFTTVDIIDGLTSAAFEEFAHRIVLSRLSKLGAGELDLDVVLPRISLEEEAQRLGGEVLRADALEAVRDSQELFDHAAAMPTLEIALLVKWASFHGESVRNVAEFAHATPAQWRNRVNNYGYAALFTLRERKVGIRKFYAGWRQYCQLSDRNIRYLLRLVHEAFRMAAEGREESPASVASPNSPVVAPEVQTRAAEQVAETTIRELQGWSKMGGALTRLTFGLGEVFGELARSSALRTPEVTQFRVRLREAEDASLVDALLAEAVGQGVLLRFPGDKNGRATGATKDWDYQLHPVFSPFFVYSSRSKRRIVLEAKDLLELSARETSSAAVKRILRGREHKVVPEVVETRAATLFDGTL